MENVQKECHSQQGAYIAQLHRMNEAIQLKRPHRQGQTIHFHNNARPHVAQVVKAPLQELK